MDMSILLYLHWLYTMKKQLFVISIIITTLIVFLFVPSTKALVITNRKKQNERIISIDGYRKGFIISYTHSVNKGRVHDFYKSENNHLELYQTQFVSYGAGIPEPYETPGAVFEVTENGYFIKNLNRKLPKFIMAVGVIADHSIIIGDFISDSGSDKSNEIFLTEYFLPQTSLVFEIKRVSLLDCMLSKKI